MKQSFTWWSFNKGQPIDEFLKLAADIGYDAFEVIDEAEFPLAKKYDLEVSLHWGTCHLIQGLNKCEFHAETLNELEAHIKFAEEWKIANLVFFGGNCDGKSDDEGAEITAEILYRVAPLAESAGVRWVLKFLELFKLRGMQVI